MVVACSNDPASSRVEDMIRQEYLEVDCLLDEEVFDCGIAVYVRNPDIPHFSYPDACYSDSADWVMTADNNQLDRKQTLTATESPEGCQVGEMDCSAPTSEEQLPRP